MPWVVLIEADWGVQFIAFASYLISLAALVEAGGLQDIPFQIKIIN